MRHSDLLVSCLGLNSVLPLDRVPSTLVFLIGSQLCHSLIIPDLSSRLDPCIRLVNGLAIDDDDRKRRERCGDNLPSVRLLSFRTFSCEGFWRLRLSLVLLLALNPARVDRGASNALLDLLSLFCIRLCDQDWVNVALLRPCRIRRYSFIDLCSALVTCYTMVLLKYRAEQLQRRR